jgi:outer membrane protein OmpA-like peptidoglycan-associated protein
MNRGISVALLATLFYGALLCTAILLSQPDIEEDLKKRAKAALEQIENLPSTPDLVVKGRDVMIEGEVYSQEQLQQVREAIMAIKDIRVLADNMSIRFLAPSSLMIQQVDDGWLIEGRLGNNEGARGIEEALRGQLKAGEKLQGRVRVEAHTRPSGWPELVSEWFGQFQEMVSGNARLEIIGNKLWVSGEVFSKQQQDGIMVSATSHFSGSELELIDKVTIVQAPDPPKLIIEQDEGGDFIINGQVRGQAFKERILEELQGSRVGGTVSEQLSTGEHVRPASWETPLVRLLPALVTEVEGLRVRAEEDGFMMAGTVRGQEKKQSIDDTAAQLFSGMSIEVDNQLQIFVAPDPASFVISRGEDHVLRLKGILPDSQMVDRFMASVTSALEAGQPSPVNEIETGDNVSDAPWVETMCALMKPFILNVHWGALSIHEDSDGEYPQVALEAEVKDPAGGDILQALLENAFPRPNESVVPDEQPRYQRVIDLVLAKPAGPTDEDIAALEKAVTDTVIYFESTSFRVNPEERLKLSLLAEQFTKVPGASLALLGYADPFGDASYNRELSRKRCKAVRDILVELGIEFLLLEIEQKGETEKSQGSRSYKSARRVEFELR